MRVAVIQPSYSPWLGYFWMMKNVDLFIYYTNVQYDKNGWRNRNRVIAHGKQKWLTLALNKQSMSSQLSQRDLRSVELVDSNQFNEHMRLLQIYYKNSCHVGLFDRIYQPQLSSHIFLSDATIAHTEIIANLISIRSSRVTSDEILGRMYSIGEEFNSPNERKNKKLLNLLKSVGCTTYISGISASSYIDLDLFRCNGISVEWNRFAGDTINLSILHYLAEKGLEGVLDLIS